MKILQILALVLCLFQTAQAQRPTQLTVNTFVDTSYSDTEPAYDYDFVPPVQADVLSANPANYEPDMDNRYFMSIFGPRHKSVSTSNIGYFDFHKGSDMTAVVSHGGVDYDEDTPPNIQCMCDGEVYNTFDDENLGQGEDIEDTGTGRYVTIKCDSTFKGNP